MVDLLKLDDLGLTQELDGIGFSLSLGNVDLSEGASAYNPDQLKLRNVAFAVFDVSLGSLESRAKSGLAHDYSNFNYIIINQK